MSLFGPLWRRGVWFWMGLVGFECHRCCVRGVVHGFPACIIVRASVSVQKPREDQKKEVFDEHASGSPNPVRFLDLDLKPRVEKNEIYMTPTRQASLPISRNEPLSCLLLTLIQSQWQNLRFLSHNKAGGMQLIVRRSTDHDHALAA
ncbi:hypothetical protein ONS96_014247 [Cadophora gregata f. sp. sojae]|nr:hypothetical protein ONS96_014247 [Cadophora gregata f. sp. sojae]